MRLEPSSPPRNAAFGRPDPMMAEVGHGVRLKHLAGGCGADTRKLEGHPSQNHKTTTTRSEQCMRYRQVKLAFII